MLVVRMVDAVAGRRVLELVCEPTRIHMFPTSAKYIPQNVIYI